MVNNQNTSIASVLCLVDMVGVPAVDRFVESLVFDAPARMADLDDRAG